MNSEKLETTVEILKEMAFTATETQRRALEDAISAISDYKKMQEISLDLAFENDELINKSRWIPVSEENLPENFQNVLVTIVRYDGTKMVRMAEYHENPKLSRKTFRILENNERWEVGEEQLLAWMPKPKPYKAERGETDEQT